MVEQCVGAFGTLAFPQTHSVIIGGSRVAGLALGKALAVADDVVGEARRHVVSFAQEVVGARVVGRKVNPLEQSFDGVVVIAAQEKRQAEPHRQARRIRVARERLRKNLHGGVERVVQQELRSPVE